MCNILLFAGTTEGRELAEYLSRCGVRVTACVATEYGQTLIQEKENLSVHSGRLDREQMQTLMQNGFGVTSDLKKSPCIDLVIDATHPYAAVVTENLLEASRTMQIPYYRCLREEGKEEDSLSGYDKLIRVENTEQAVQELDRLQGNVLLTTGSKELSQYCRVKNFSERIYPRVLPLENVVKSCLELGVLPSHLIAMQGPFSEEMNLAMIRQWNICCMVTKESGKAGGFEEKISAAKKAGITILMIGRPKEKEKQHYSMQQLKEVLKQRWGITPTEKNLPKNPYFPMFVSLQGKKVQVFGGGNIAARRISSLVKFGCKIKVISPTLHPVCEELLKQGKIEWVKRCWQSGDCSADIVLAATNHTSVNDRIADECKNSVKKILFNRCDRQDECDFYFPALIESNGLIIGLSSGGADHKKVKNTAAMLRKSLAEQDR